MKLLVTVGTTAFNSLFETLDNCEIPEHVEIECQIANGSYVPKKYQHFRFTDNFEDKLISADAVISHAGAGNVFKLLELGKSSIIVANLERKDSHQIELARYVSENDFAIGIKHLDIITLNNSLRQLQTFKPAPYRKQAFRFAEQLNSKIIEQCQLQLNKSGS